MKKDKEEMKELLWRWGQAMEQFSWKEEEVNRLQVFCEMQKCVWEKNPMEREKRELERIEKENREEIGRLRIEMVEILREKRWVDEMISKMKLDEKQFLQMRFEKGYGFEYISMKMHLSRATLFRLQDKVLEKMIEMKNGDDMRLY